jgi:hypothetical protein
MGTIGCQSEVRQNGTQISGVDVNAGISGVIPSDELHGLLMNPVLVEARRSIAENRERLKVRVAADINTAVPGEP